MRLFPLATTADGFRTFGSYVAAIDAGRVVFTATLDDGRTALVFHDGERSRVLAAAGDDGIAAWVSHPDLDARGRVTRPGEPWRSARGTSTASRRRGCGTAASGASPRPAGSRGSKGSR